MAGVTVLVLFASCGNSNKTDADPFASITHLVDSAMVNKTDSIDREKTSDEPKPIEADESFDDFIYNFASDDALQRQRVVFPLPYYNGERASKIDRKYWKHDDLFAKQSYYTLLFDREEDMDLVGDTSLTSVQVEWIFVKKRMVKKYYFERIKGRGCSKQSICVRLRKTRTRTLLNSSVILRRIVFSRAGESANRLSL